MRMNDNRLTPVAGAVVCALALLLGACDSLESTTTQHTRKVEQAVDSARRLLIQARLKREDGEFKAFAASRLAQAADLRKELLSGNAAAVGDTAAYERDMVTLQSQAATLNDQSRKDLADAQKAQAEAEKLLQDASSDATAAAAAVANARFLRAQATYDTAMVTARQLEPLSLEARRLTWELHRLVDRIQQNNALAASYAMRAPTSAPAGQEGAVAPAQAIENAKAGLTKLRTDLEAALAEQDKAISAKKAQLDTLKQQKADADAQATELLRKADAAKGAESFNFYKQGQDANEKGQLAAAQMERGRLELAELERNRKAIEIQVELNKKAAEHVEAQAAQLDQAWQAVQKAQGAVDASSKAIVGPAAESGPSTRTVVDVGNQLQQVAKAMQEKRQQAETLLKSAAAQVSEANDKAKAANGELQKLIVENQGTPRTAVFKKLQDLNDPDRYMLARARIDAALGWLRAADADLAAAQTELVTALQNTKVAAPADALGAVRDPEPLRQAAYDAYQSALDQFLKLKGEFAGAGRLGAMFVRYGMYHLRGNKSDLDAARQDFEALAREVREAGKPVSLLPSLPTDLAPLPAPTEAPPATAPAPASAPSPENTPATAPTPPAEPAPLPPA